MNSYGMVWASHAMHLHPARGRQCMIHASASTYEYLMATRESKLTRVVGGSWSDPSSATTSLPDKRYPWDGRLLDGTSVIAT